MVSLPIIETVVNLITAVMTAGGLAALFGLMAVESFGIPPLPSEVILPFAGFLVFSGVYTFPEAFVAALAGGVVGAFAAYAVGRFGRSWIESSGTGRLRLDPKHLASMDRWFARFGEPTVALGRLLPIVRAYISYPAGTSKMEPAKFGLFTALGAAPFTAGLLYAGLVLGKNWKSIQGTFRYLDYVAAAVIVVLIVYLALRWRGVIGSRESPKAAPTPDAPRPTDDAPP